MRRALRLAPALAAALALCGAALPADTTTTVETTATAAVDFPPDRLYIAIDVESEAGSTATVGNKQLDEAVARITAAGIPPSALAKRFIATPDPKWKRLSSDLDPRPYGILLLEFPNPPRTALVALTEKTLTAALDRALDDNTFAEVGGAWYGLDDCRRLRIAARKGSLALARERGERLATVAGYTLDASGGVRAAAALDYNSADGDEAGQSYLCGRGATPDIPPPGLRSTNVPSERNGFVEEESTITVDWPTLPLAIQHPVPVPRTLTSLGSEPESADAAPAPLLPGTLRANVSVSSADIRGSGCTYDAALGTAIALGAKRAAAAGRLVGLVPDHPIAILDTRAYRALCPGRGPAEGAASARISETFAAVSAPHGRGVDSHFEVNGAAELRLPADRARVSASVVPGPLADPKDATARLAAAGLDKPGIAALPGAWRIEGFVAHPTAATMGAIDGVIGTLAATGTTPAKAFSYALDDCAGLDDRLLREAVAAAQSAARTAGRNRGVRTRGVSAIAVGPLVVRYCGPHVLEKLPGVSSDNASAATAATDPSVTANGTVRLQYLI